jgi:hypothetical protein
MANSHSHSFHKTLMEPGAQSIFLKNGKTKGLNDTSKDQPFGQCSCIDGASFPINCFFNNKTQAY